MAIENEVQEDGRLSQVDALMLNVARGRVAIGVATLVLPGLSVRAMGLGNGSAKDGGRDVVARMFAAREIALGAGYLLSKGPNRKIWARLGLVVDTLDTVTGTKARKAGVPLWAAAGFTAIAAGAAAVGAAKVAKDGLR